MMKRWLWVILAALLLALRPDRVASQPADVQAGIWDQSTAADLSRGTLTNLDLEPDGTLSLEPATSGLSNVGTYVTAIGMADFAFTHLVARWVAEVPEGTGMIVEVRARAQDGEWTHWMPLLDPHEENDPGGPENRLEAEGNIFGENILALRDGEYMQARFTFASAHPHQSPTLHSVSLVYLDASKGPTTEGASAQALALSPKSPGRVPAPAIIPRSAWGANESWMTWPPQYAPVEKIVVHHTVTENDDPDPAATVRAIYYYHAVIRGWGDIGYNYLIDRFGNIYEGRSGGYDVVGGHAYGYNVGSLGIGNMGTFGNTPDSVEPTSAMLDALSNLSAWAVSRRLIHPQGEAVFYERLTPNITGHRDYGTTACPGDYLYAELPGVRDAAWAMVGAHHLDYSALWCEHSTPVQVLPGVTVAVSLNVENAGTTTWPAGGANPVRLGYHWYNSAGQEVILPPEGDHRSALPADTPFGGVVSWSMAQLTAPDTPGIYTLQWDLVLEGVAWFRDLGNQTLEVPIIVREVQDRAFAPAVFAAFGTPEPTPTPTPSPTPTVGNCSQLVVNGDFETNEGWVLNDTPADAHYTTDTFYAGNRALRVGIPPDGQNQYSYSSADQAISIPAGIESATLSLWRYPLSADDAGDFEYLMIRDEMGSWHTLLSGRENVASWLYAEYDLGAFIGQTIVLRIGAYNDGTEGVTSFTVDNVDLLACP